jgi:hypothetical protein
MTTTKPGRGVGRPRGSGKGLGKTFPIRFSQPTLDSIATIAEERGIKPSALVREWVNEGIERHRKHKAT